MANEKQKSKKAFNQQAVTYDQDMRGQHAGLCTQSYWKNYQIFPITQRWI